MPQVSAKLYKWLSNQLRSTGPEGTVFQGVQCVFHIHHVNTVPSLSHAKERTCKDTKQEAARTDPCKLPRILWIPSKPRVSGELSLEAP